MYKIVARVYFCVIMMESVAFVLVLLVCLAKANVVDYFVDLIKEEEENALNFKLPRSALQYKSAPMQNLYGNYDYVVIGAGGSGSVIAHRLSERKDWKILVVEAGGLETNFTNIPGMAHATIFSEYNWGYQSVPQKGACLGFINRTCLIHQGKGVGGTTIFNNLMYVRPNKHDFERLESEGIHGWSYKDVLPYFIKSEKSAIPDADKGYHGKEGFLNVEYRTPQSPHLDAFLEANLELERNIVDYNGEKQMGVSPTQHNTKFGVRVSNGKAFIKTALHRQNLRLLINAYATKILIDENNVATGVEFSHNNKRHIAFAKKEVIVAAGPINSPRLLQSSGIGPRKLLEKLKIPIVADLPVGKHLTEHPTFFGLYFETNHSTPVKSLKGYVQDFLKGRGPLTTPSNNQGVGFFRTHLARFPHTPDLQMTLIVANSSNTFTPKLLNMQNDTSEALFGDSDPTREFSVWIHPTQPLSEGVVEIRSKNPFLYPRIDVNYLANLYDLETLYAGIQMVFEIINTQPFRVLDAQYSPRPLPACSDYEFVSKEYWYCAIRQLTSGIGDIAGTCRMGSDSENGVVDNKLRVFVVKNLRVADASIFPFPLTGHMGTASTLVGEMVSDFIKNGSKLL